MPFRSVVGHHHVLALLARAVARHSLPPSLILSGPEGVGKHRVAVALAEALNCLDPVREGQASRLAIDACGVCAACRRIERGIFPDVFTVGIEDDASSIGVKQARDISERASFRPYEGRRRVVIVDPADAMERFAQNALLKLLEEPPPATVIVLVTARPDVLLPTVRSRCPQIRFGPLTAAEIADVLARERKLTEREATAAAVVAGGSVATAIESASDETTSARAQALAVLRDVASGRDRSVAERLRATLGVEKRQGTAAEERDQVALVLRALSSLVRDLAVLAEAGDRSDLANADLLGELQALR